METQSNYDVDREIYRALELVILTYEIEMYDAKLRGAPLASMAPEDKCEYMSLTRTRDAMKAEFRRRKLPVPRAPATMKRTITR
jgi:hypothetical protein